MIRLMLSETKNDFPITDGSRPNQVLQSSSLMTTTSSWSSGTGMRPSYGRTPRVAYMSFDGHAMGMRSTRSCVRKVDVPAPKMKMPSISFDLSL